MESERSIGALAYREATSREDGLPRTDWNLPLGRLKTPDEWLGFIDRWLADVAESYFSPRGVITEVNGVYCVSRDAERSERTAVIADTLLDRLNEMLPLKGEGDEADQEWPVVVIEFADPERYYDYVSQFDSPEGEFPTSIGSFIRNAYPQIVLNSRPGFETNATLAHEFVHYCLSPMSTPLWLEEGLAEILPAVIFRSGFYIDRDLVSRHRAHWNGETIQGFWDGGSFRSPETSELAYSFAQIVTNRLIEKHGRASIRAFIEEASFEDAGDAASTKHLGAPIADAVAACLGPGDWSPRPGGFWFNKPSDEQDGAQPAPRDPA